MTEEKTSAERAVLIPSETSAEIAAHASARQGAMSANFGRPPARRRAQNMIGRASRFRNQSPGLGSHARRRAAEKDRPERRELQHLPTATRLGMTLEEYRSELDKMTGPHNTRPAIRARRAAAKRARKKAEHPDRFGPRYK